MRRTDDGSLGDLGVRHKCRFDFCGSHSVARNVNNVIDPARNPIIAVLIAATAVTGEILARECTEIGFHEPLVIAEHRSHLPRPGVENAQIAFCSTFQNIPFAIDESWLNTEEWPCCRARFQSSCAWQWRDQNATGLRLPPGVYDRASALTDNIVIPKPSFWINGLADGSEKAN